MTTIDARTEAAIRLVRASRDGIVCAPIRELVPDATVDDAYAIQSLIASMTARPDRRRIGRKIGLTSPVVQEQMGVDEPDFGVLFSDMVFVDGQPIPDGLLLQPRIEAEVAFVLGSDLDMNPVTAVDVLRATDFVVPAIEIVDSRVRDWDISIIDTVADNASAGILIVGGAPRRLTEIGDLREIEMRLRCGDEVISAGDGAACLGHPVNAMTWLANTMVQRADPLRAGELVLSGALGPLIPAERGRLYEAELSGLGSVRADFRD